MINDSLDRDRRPIGWQQNHGCWGYGYVPWPFGHRPLDLREGISDEDSYVRDNEQQQDQEYISKLSTAVPVKQAQGERLNKGQLN